MLAPRVVPRRIPHVRHFAAPHMATSASGSGVSPAFPSPDNRPRRDAPEYEHDGKAFAHPKVEINRDESSPEAKRFWQLSDQMNAYSEKGKVDLCMPIFDEMLLMKLPRFGIRTMMYNTVMKAYANSGNLHGGEKWLHRMLGDRIRLNHKTFGKLVEAAAKTGDSAAAERIMQQGANFGLDAHAYQYSMLVNAACKAGDISKAIKNMDIMKKLGVPVTSVTYTAVLDYYAKRGATVACEEWFQKMVDAGVEPDRANYTCVINSHAKRGNIQEAEVWFAKMQQAGMEIHPGLYALMMNACARGRDPLRAEMWMEKLQASGLADNSPIAYTSCIDAWGRVGNVANAKKWFANMVSNGIDANRISCNALLGAYRGQPGGTGDEALALFENMVSAGLEADEITLTCVMRAYANENPPNACGARKVLVKLLAMGFKPDEITIMWMTRAFSNSYEDIIRLLRRAHLEWGVPLNAGLVNNARIRMKNKADLVDNLLVELGLPSVDRLPPGRAKLRDECMTNLTEEERMQLSELSRPEMFPKSQKTARTGNMHQDERISSRPAKSRDHQY